VGPTELTRLVNNHLRHIHSLNPERPQMETRRIDGIVLFGRFGPPFLTAARTFSRARIGVTVVEIGTGQPHKRSNAVDAVYMMSPGDVGTASGIRLLSEILSGTKAQALLALSDPHLLWLAASRKWLPATCKLLLPDLEFLKFILSKKNQLRVAASCGFDVLPTWELYSEADVAQIPAAVFPVCLRPSDPETVVPTFKVEYLPSQSELVSFLGGRTWANEPLLVQPFCPVPNVIVHGVRSQAGQILELRAFFAGRKFEGVSLQLRGYALAQELEAKCRQFATRIGVVGPFHFDLLCCPDPAKYYFLEMNARLGGTTDKVYKLGFDEPLLTLSAFGFDVALQHWATISHRPVVNRRVIVKHIWWAIKGKLSPLDYPVVSRWVHIGLSLRDFVLAKDSVACITDLKGTWSLYSHYSRSQT
jgi:hypothetical protein